MPDPVFHPQKPTAQRWRVILAITADLAVVVAFFLPWVKYEVLVFTGYELPFLAFEYWGKNTSIAIAFLVFSIPMAAIIHLWSLIFGFKKISKIAAGVALVSFLSVVGILLFAAMGNEFELAVVYGFWITGGGLLAVVLGLKFKPF